MERLVKINKKILLDAHHLLSRSDERHKNEQIFPQKKNQLLFYFLFIYHAKNTTTTHVIVLEKFRKSSQRKQLKVQGHTQFMHISDTCQKCVTHSIVRIYTAQSSALLNSSRPFTFRKHACLRSAFSLFFLCVCETQRKIMSLEVFLRCVHLCCMNEKLTTKFSSWCGNVSLATPFLYVLIISHFPEINGITDNVREKI